MTPLPQTKVQNLVPIFDAMVKEANLSERSSKEHCLSKLIWGYTTRGMDAYVDDTDNPKHVIIFGLFPGIVTNELIDQVLFIYSVPEERGTPESFAAFEEQINAHAAIKNADAIAISDWQYLGCQMGVGAFARRLGFVRQEVIHVKVIKAGLAFEAPPQAENAALEVGRKALEMGKDFAANGTV